MGPLSKQGEGQALGRVPETVGPEAFSVDAQTVLTPKTVEYGEETFGNADELRQKVKDALSLSVPIISDNF